ncbi:MAG: hypothetical protein ABSC05_13885 [Candidatus Solibacter sp.]|jgi:hypothetical protein
MRVWSWLLAFGLTAAAGRVVTFDNGPLGKTPPEWTVAMTNHGQAPQWEIVKDATAATQPYVFAQVSADPVHDRYPLAIFNDLTFCDGEVSVRLKPVSGRMVQAGGLVWRYRDENNYYLARANALQKNVQVFKVENGNRVPLMDAVRHEIPTNGWSILKVSARGNRFQVYVDHRRVLQGWDNTFLSAGKVGLWTVADSVTYFDEFRVNPR